MTIGNKLCIITILGQHTGMSKLVLFPFEQWVVYHVSCDLCDTDYVGYTKRSDTFFNSLLKTKTRQLGNIFFKFTAVMTN